MTQKVYELLKEIRVQEPERIVVYSTRAGVTVYDSEDFRTYESGTLDIVFDLFRFADEVVQHKTFDGITLRIVI
jgi:hypothetical protein